MADSKGVHGRMNVRPANGFRRSDRKVVLTRAIVE